MLVNASTKLVVNFAASLGGSEAPLADYYQGANLSHQSRIEHISLDYATIPNSWSIVHPRFDNNVFQLTVWVVGVPHLVRFTINTDGLSVYSTGAHVAAAIQTAINIATFTLGVTWTVVYDPTTGTLTVAITSGGGSTYHWNSTPNPDGVALNRSLFCTGYYLKAIQVRTIADARLASSAVSITGFIMDLQPIKSVFVMIDGSTHGAQMDSSPAHGTFIVPVKANYGSHSVYDAGVSFENIVYFHDHSFADRTLRIRITDRSGQLIPFTGGEIELILSVQSRDRKRPRGD